MAYSLLKCRRRFGAGLGATLNVAKPAKGSTVAIFGLGAVGLAVSGGGSFMRFIYFNNDWNMYGMNTHCILYTFQRTHDRSGYGRC